jgi:hypothetical protein
LKSIAEHLEIATAKIAEEVALGRMAGPFDQSPMDKFRCSPIGLVPKRETGKYRLIHHLSWPRGSSVNDGISDEESRVSYTKFDTVVEKLLRPGRGTLMAKADIKSAFRLMPVHPNDFGLLGLSLDGKFYYDMCLPMGAKSSCAIFEKFSTFLNWCLRRAEDSSSDSDHYLDDFIVMGRANTTACQRKLNQLVNVCSDLGVPLAHDKFEGPATSICFLGLELDSLSLEVRVPPEKVHKSIELLNSLMLKHKVSLRELQSTIGALNFLCRAIRPGRAFLQRIISLTRDLKKPHYMVRLSEGPGPMFTCGLGSYRNSTGERHSSSLNGLTAQP